MAAVLAAVALLAAPFTAAGMVVAAATSAVFGPIMLLDSLLGLAGELL